MTQKRAIVLAAGKGTRMKTDQPKVLVPALGVPMIEYVLDALRKAGVTEIIIVVGYGGDQVRNALSKYGDLIFAEQTEQRGTGHAVMICRDALANKEGPVFVIAGDNPLVQSETVTALFDEFEKRTSEGGTSCILGTIYKENPIGLGRILRDEDGNFLDIVEEKDANDQQRRVKEVNMSYYVFDIKDMTGSFEALKTNNAQKEYYITDIPKILLQKGKKVFALPILKPMESLGINTMDDLKLVEEAMKDLHYTRR